ncbi:MAG: thiol:disulfide interchange protein DsbA/DsbL [Proteobacteria bacterium]|jgi:protein dithiol oxidoreductase (disulfide-forming)|nr:thiol:disulfide interchange protein DsbA/DsbL [Pseudomonadota bacterium]MBK9250466.1 thiol:disulfide interchange protein DsbA/DsbL [Pseudomonadota bacterium]MCC6631566.1 thiol:disulfide interchange protein DsbA/DsbL [Gammaproteobacteria bacterium]
MNKLPVLVLALAALVAGCSNKSETAAPAEAPAADAASQPESPAAAPTAEQIKQAAAAAQESGGTEESPGDASLERMAAMPESAQLPAGKWKVGVNYKPIVPAQPTSADAGQVEVLEVLWLGCPHCYELEPYMEAWNKKKPAHVKFVQEAVMWGPVHRAHGRLFYTLQALGRDDLVVKAFEQIHRRNNILLSPTGNDAQTQSLQQAFATANGVKEADFKREYNGFSVNTRLQRAEELMRRYRVESVPLVIVNGKYQTDVGMAGSPEKLVSLIEDLVATEKSR